MLAERAANFWKNSGEAGGTRTLHPVGPALNPKDGEIYVSDRVQNALFTYLALDFFGQFQKPQNVRNRGPVPRNALGDHFVRQAEFVGKAPVGPSFTTRFLPASAT